MGWQIGWGEEPLPRSQAGPCPEVCMPHQAAVGCSRPHQDMLGHSRLQQATLGRSRLQQATLGCSWLQQATVGHARPCQATVGCSRPHQAAVGHTRPHQAAGDLASHCGSTATRCQWLNTSSTFIKCCLLFCISPSSLWENRGTCQVCFLYLCVFLQQKAITVLRMPSQCRGATGPV